MKALLIIDMQKGCFAPHSSHYDTMGVIERINTLSDKFRQKRYPVIFIQHDGTVEGELFPNTDEWMLLPELTKISTDIYIDKTANDSFYQSSLKQVLSSLNVEELYIAGAATDFCVDATVKSALSKDFKVVVVSDGHTTEDRGQLQASSLVQYYNWLWRAMAPTKHKIVVETSDSIELI